VLIRVYRHPAQIIKRIKQIKTYLVLGSFLCLNFYEISICLFIWTIDESKFQEYLKMQR